MATSSQSIGPASTSAPPVSRDAKVVDPVAGRGIAALLTPSLSDCFFIALVVWLFICGAGGWQTLLADGDTGWHIRTGQYILENHAVPRQDLFSFSRAGAPWFAWEWLTDVVYALLFGVSGLKGIVLLSGLMIALFATVVLLSTLWRGANALVAAVTTLLAVGAASMHFLARPHLFTLVLLPSCLWLIEADRRQNTRWLWMLIPITALWTNLHGGFVVFLACIAVLVAASGIEMACGLPRLPQLRRYSVLLLGCTLASLINPYGIQLHRHVYEYLRSDWIRNVVQEFQAPTFRTEGQLQFELLLLSGLALIALWLRKRLFAEALWILFLAHASLNSVRHAPVYAVVAAPLVACELSDWWRASIAGMKKSSALRILYQLGSELTAGFRRTSIWPVVFIIALAVMDAPLKWPRDFPSEKFPITMVNRHAQQIASGRLLTEDQWGDYIIYRFYPRQKVYVDGRSDFYGEKVGQEYLHLMQGAYDWRSILDQRGFDVALLPVDWPLASMLKADRSWRVVEDDSKTILFQRVSGSPAGKSALPLPLPPGRSY